MWQDSETNTMSKEDSDRRNKKEPKGEEYCGQKEQQKSRQYTLFGN